MGFGNFIQGINTFHNHEPSTDLFGYPTCRRLFAEDINNIDKMSHSGIAPKEIVSSLRGENPDIRAMSRAIYNAKTKIYKDNLCGRTPIHALFEELG